MRHGAGIRSDLGYASTRLLGSILLGTLLATTLVLSTQNCGQQGFVPSSASNVQSCIPRTRSSFAENKLQADAHELRKISTLRRLNLKTSKYKQVSAADERPELGLYLDPICAKAALDTFGSKSKELEQLYPMVAMLSYKAKSRLSKWLETGSSDQVTAPIFMRIRPSLSDEDFSRFRFSLERDPCSYGATQVRRHRRLQVDPRAYSRQPHITSINAPSAWDLAFSVGTQVGLLGSLRPRIAILDDGVAMAHPDLAGNILAPGYNAYAPDSPTKGNPYRLNDPDTGQMVGYDEHGTHVAGLAAAVADNNNGVVGASGRQAQILPIYALFPGDPNSSDPEEQAGGFFEDIDIFNGAVWAVANGAHVINLSLGGLIPGGSTSTADQQLLSILQQNGVFAVVSAGNTSRFCDVLPHIAQADLSPEKLGVPRISIPGVPNSLRCDSQAYNTCRSQNTSTAVDSDQDPCVYYQAYPYDLDDVNRQSTPMRWLKNRISSRGVSGLPPNYYLTYTPAILARSYSCVISVAATDDAPASNTALGTFSSYGAVSVEISAPGTSTIADQLGRGLVSTVPGTRFLSEDRYGRFEGTSMASPLVAGAAALAYGVIQNLTNSPRCPAVCAAVKQALLQSADVVPALNGRVNGQRRLNVQALLARLEADYRGRGPLCTAPPPISITPIPRGSVPQGQSLPFCN